MRCFLGIGLPQDVREAVAEAVRGLPDARGAVSWVAKENLHITLIFLGEIQRERLSSFEEGLSEVASGFPPFILEAFGGGAFPGPGNPRVLWAGLREPLELVGKLQQNMKKTLLLAGFPEENRPFHPHVTIGRVRGVPPPGWGDRFLKEFEGRGFGAVPVSSFMLFESRLSKGGAIYSVIREFPFGNGPRHGESEKETAR